METSQIWERTLPLKSSLKEEWKEDTLTIAKSQLGYKESERNFIVTEDGEHKGYNRYGEMFGNPYGDWCAMFLQFCMHYADVDDRIMEGNPSVPLWVEDAKENKNFFELGDKITVDEEEKDFEPQPSDIIFFEWEGDESPDHVGIVDEIKKNDDDEITIIVTIEGNSQNEVRRNTYKIDDEHIFGFSRIPDKMTEEEIEKILEEREAVKQEAKEAEEAAAEEAKNANKKQYIGVDGTLVSEGEDYTIEVTYTAEAGIPENATLLVQEIAQDTSAYSTYNDMAAEQVYGQTEVLPYARFFDITICDEEGFVVEPKSAVSVVIDLQDDDFNAEDSEVAAVHFVEEAKEEPVQIVTPKMAAVAEEQVAETEQAEAAEEAKTEAPEQAEAESQEAQAQETTTETTAETVAPIVVPFEPITEVNPEAIVETTVIAVENTNQAVAFDADGFSVYGVIIYYTVDFYYTVGEVEVEAEEAEAPGVVDAIANAVGNAAAEGEATEGEEGEAEADATAEGEETEAEAAPASNLLVNEYHMPGGSSMMMSQLFVELGINRSTADIASVEFTDETLVAFTGQDDDYLIQSLKPFLTHEKLTITMSDGEVIVIQVEDDQQAVTGNSASDNPYATVENGQYVVKSWTALERLIENGQYKDGSGTVWNNAGDTLNVIIDGKIAANSQIITNGKTIDLGGRNDATIYVDSKDGTKIENEMFWVNGGRFDVSNVTFSGKKATYTPPNNDTSDCMELSNSKITVGDSVLKIGGVRLSKHSSVFKASNTEGYGLSAALPSDPETKLNTISVNTEYLLFADANLMYSYLRSTGTNGGYEWFNADISNTTDLDSLKWKLRDDNVFVNVKNSSVIIYKDKNGNLSVTQDISGDCSSGSGSGSGSGTWTPIADSTVDSVVTNNTKGFFIAADNGAQVKLNGGTVIQDMKYTGTTAEVSPIYVKGSNTKLEINGAVIKNNQSRIPALQSEERKLFYNDVLDWAINHHKDRSWDINPGGTDYRRGHDSDAISAGAIRIENATVDLNSGTLGGDDTGNTGIAGAVYIDGGTFNQNGGTINGNHALKGAVVVDGSNSTYNLNTGLLENNDSSIYGGAISVFDEGKVFVGNTSQTCDEDSVPVIRGNKTLHQGGGIYVHSDYVQLNRARIENNIAHFMGGGIYVYGGDAKQNDKNSVLILDDTYITDNKAGNKFFTESDGQYGFNDIWDPSDHTYGQGGGMWLCTYGSFIMDGNEIHIWGNQSEEIAPDFYKHSSAAASGIITEFKPYIKDNVQLDQYKQTNNNDAPYPPASFTPVTGRLALRNDASYTAEMNAMCDSVRITGNRAGYAGGGIGSNGIISYKPLKNENIYQPEFSFTKDFKEKTVDGTPINKAGKSATFNVKVYQLPNESEPVAEYNNIVLRNGANAVDDPNGVNSTGVKVQDWTAYITLPQLFGADGVSIYEGIVENKPPTMTGDNNTSSYNIDTRIKIVIEEVGVTDGTQDVSAAYELKLGTMGFNYTDNTISNNQQDLSITYHTIKFSTTLTNVTDNGKIQITKKDKRTGDVIANDDVVEFKYSPVVDGVITNTEGIKISNNNGVFTTDELAPGKYVIWESVPPNGYIGLGEGKIYVTIAADGTPSVDTTNTTADSSLLEVGSVSSGTLPITVSNKPAVGLSIVKVDENGESVTGNTTFEIRHFGYGESGAQFSPIEFTLSESNTYTINNVVSAFTGAGLPESNIENTRFYIIEKSAHNNGTFEKLEHVIPFKIVKENGVYTFSVMNKTEVDAHPKGKDAANTSFAQTGKTRSVIGIEGQEVYVEWKEDGKGIEDVAISDVPVGSITYTVTNHKKPGQLEIEKELQGAGANDTYLYGSNTKFYFDIGFGGTTSTEVAYKIVEGDTVVSTGTVEVGPETYATIGITPSQKIAFDNLPIGTTYGVRESTKVTFNGVDTYIGHNSGEIRQYAFVEYQKNGVKQPEQQAGYIKGVIEDSAVIKVEKIKAINKENTGEIKLKKVLNGADDTTTKFNFEFKSTHNGADYTNFVVEKGTDGNTTSTTGNGTIELANNEEVTIKNLPLGSTWTIEEKDIPETYRLLGFSINGTEATPTGNKISGGTVNSLATVNVIATNYKIVENKTPAYLTITAKKALENGTDADLKDEYNGQFLFTIEAINPTPNAPLPDVTTVRNEGNLVHFGLITYDTAGTYYYKIKEVVPEGQALEGIDYDDTEKTITVEVKERTILGTNNTVKEKYIYSVTSSDGNDTVELESGSTTYGGVDNLGSNVTITTEPYSFRYITSITGNTASGIGLGATYKSIAGNVAYCMDETVADPDNGTSYAEFDLSTSVSGFTQQVSSEELVRIKKLFYVGYPNDSGTGAITDKITRLYRASFNGDKTSQYYSPQEEWTQQLFRMATQKVLWELMDGKTSSNSSFKDLSEDNQLARAVMWIYAAIDAAQDSVTNEVILHGYLKQTEKGQWVWNARRGRWDWVTTGETVVDTEKQRIITAIIAKNLKVATLKTAFNNKIELQDVEIEKVNLEGEHELLPGAKFTLTDADGNVTNLTETSTAGKFKATGIRKNSVYTLTETKAPNEFMLLGTDNPIKFKVNNDGTIALTEDNTSIVKSMVQASSEDNTLKLVVSNKEYPSIKIKKVGDGRRDNPLSGAQFQLIVKEVNGISADTIFEGTTNNGQPKEYVNVFDLNCEGGIGTTYNQKKYYVNLKNDTQGERKLDQYGFLIYKTNGSLILNSNGNWVRYLPKEVDATNNMVFTSGTDGIIDLGQLPVGKYELHETVAPAGHNKLVNPITITVSANGTVTAAGDMIHPDTDVTSSGNTYEIYVTNTSGAVLPNTGGVGTAIFTFGGIILVVGAALGLMLRKKDATDEE